MMPAYSPRKRLMALLAAAAGLLAAPAQAATAAAELPDPVAVPYVPPAATAPQPLAAPVQPTPRIRTISRTITPVVKPKEKLPPKEDSTMIVAAGQAGGQRATYATTGVIAALPGSSLGRGWVARVFADEITYRYKGAGSTDIDATALGGHATVGYQYSFNEGWIGAYAGVGYHHTHLSPGDPGSHAAGGKTSGHFQLEGERNLSPDFKLNANAAGDASSNPGYWGRLRALQRISGNIYAGPEGVLQGDRDYKAWQAGVAVVGVPLTDKASIGVDGGVRKTDSQSLSGYGGLELGSVF